MVARETAPRDRRDVANYTLPEASRWLGLSPGTLRAWLFGRHDKAARLVVPAQEQPPGLSFWNLVECSVLGSIRRDHGVSMQRVRKALRYVQKRLEVDRPLIHQRFQTDGAHLFLEEYGRLVSASEGGQQVMKGLLEAGLRRIEVDEQGLAARLFPWAHEPDEPRAVAIDPRVAFGRLVLAGTGVTVDAVLERFQAGESLGALADDFRVPVVKLEDLLRWAVVPAAA